VSREPIRPDPEPADPDREQKGLKWEPGVLERENKRLIRGCKSRITEREFGGVWILPNGGSVMGLLKFP
jgi:hypothetical protein